MSESHFCQKLKSLSLADRWLLGLCLLPAVHLLWLVYCFLGELILFRDLSIVYFLFWLLAVGCATVIPVAVVFRKNRRLSLLWLVLFALGFLNIVIETVNYVRLLDTSKMLYIQERAGGWVSEIHFAFRLLPFDVAEGYWIGIVRLALWLAIAVLFTRKCRRLKESDQRLQPVAS